MRAGGAGRNRRAVLAVLALSVAGLLVGCVFLPILGGPPPRDDEFLVPEPPAGLADVRGLVHCHSLLSHDCSGSFESIASAAAEDSCAFVALTDHLRGKPATDDGPDGVIGNVLFIPGAELNMNGGSLLAVGVRAGIDPRLLDHDLVAAIREKGGLAFVGHPETTRLESLVDADGCELINLHAMALDESKLCMFFRGIVLPPRPFLTAMVHRQAAATAVYDALARDRPLAAIGACDAHEAIRPLGPLAGAVDSYRRMFRAANTHVLVPAAAVDSLSKAQVLDALAQARSYAASELEQDATGFRFVATDKAGKVLATLGGSVPLAEGLSLDVTLPVAGGITIYRDGAPTLIVASGKTARWHPVVAGAYRVEATYDGDPWIFSSAIRVVRP